MTPQEKAKELLNRFEQYAEKPKGRIAGDFGDFTNDYKLKMLPIKQCALICVDEILSTDEVFSNIAAKYWWEEVKKEIQIY